jgi:NADH:ubiquinone oxidoreductase subunit B-like Fe-S oxidoreductase
MSDIQIVDAPAGVEGSGFFATSLDKAIGLARSNSLWPCHLQLHAAVLSLWLPWFAL